MDWLYEAEHGNILIIADAGSGWLVAHTVSTRVVFKIIIKANNKKRKIYFFQKFPFFSNRNESHGTKLTIAHVQSCYDNVSLTTIHEKQRTQKL